MLLSFVFSDAPGTESTVKMTTLAQNRTIWAYATRLIRTKKTCRPLGYQVAPVGLEINKCDSVSRSTQ